MVRVRGNSESKTEKKTNRSYNKKIIIISIIIKKNQFKKKATDRG